MICILCFMRLILLQLLANEIEYEVNELRGLFESRQSDVFRVMVS